MPYAINNGIQTYYQVEGEGPPLVLHHPLGESLACWYEYGYVEALRGHYQLILIDGRGHGKSDKPHAPEAYDLKPRAADITAVLDDLAVERAHYFGYSMGAWLGFGLAIHAPERVASLILGGAQPYGQSFAFFRQVLDNGIGAFGELFQKLSSPYPSDVDRILANDLPAIRAAVANDRPDVSAHLPSMTMPCLLFAGDADPIHYLVEQCSRELPNARFCSLPGLNHFQTFLRSDLVLPHVTRFLAETTRSQSFQPV
ncbi:MAG: hypothetical protein DCC55_29120 [Chloroflexi bacterium]|nr:MAG: hypothetical protein DCC55_29120 [Chloroflexota bacterium]